MSKSPKPHSFDKEIREQISDYRVDRRKHDAFVERQLRDADEWAILWPPAGIAFLLAKVEKERRFTRRYLRSRFGFKVALMGPNPKPGRFLKPERLPSSAEESERFLHMIAEWMAREAAFQSIKEVIAKRTSHPYVDTGETYRAVREEYRWALGMIDTFKVGLLLRTSYEDKRLKDPIRQEDSIALFSGWVGAQISLYHNKELKYYLEKEGGSPFNKLLEELPASTLIGLATLVENGEPPSKLVNVVTNPLKNAGSGTPEVDRDGRLANCDPSDMTTDEPLLERLFLARQELAAARASGKITEREYQVLELRSRDYTEDEIAGELRINKGTVKTLVHRGRKKLRLAAGE